MSNFDFLKEYDYDLWNWGDKLEHDLKVAPSSVEANATRFLERVLELLIDETGTEVDSTKEYYYKLDAVYRGGHIKYGFKNSIYDAYKLRNRIHNTNSREIEKIEVPMAKQLHKKLFYIGKKLYTDFYSQNNIVPVFVPVEVDTSLDELELIDIPDFPEITDIHYDNCIICGKPNRSSDSLCCSKCNRVMDNANTFISVRNHFGKTGKFTKYDLIEFGIPEGYANQFINSLVREDMLKVTGNEITFNNIGLDAYLSKIDNYINICELVTKFGEDKILASEIKETYEYRQGSRKNEPFNQFYKIVNEEIVNKFERDLLTTENIWKSIEYTAITENQLSRWYKRELGQYTRGNVNDSFILLNDLLKREYLDLKREGVPENTIRAELNVNKEIYDFWKKYDSDFISNLEEIKMDLIFKAIDESKSDDEIIEVAGITKKEFDDIMKVANFNDSPLARGYNKEVESRKKSFIKFLKNNDLEPACHLANFTLDDFYKYYDSADFDSEFFTQSTRILMDKFLAQRRLGKTRNEATDYIGIKKIYVDRWLKRSMYADFRKEELNITVNLILKGFKNNKSLDEISEVSGISVAGIERFLRVGADGDETFKPLFEYYENEMIPQKLDDFLKEFKIKPIRKALDASHLKQGELDKYYELGKNGDERFAGFYEEFYKAKKSTYIYFYLEKEKSHEIAMRESQLTDEEYLESKDELDNRIMSIRFIIVCNALLDEKTSNVIAKEAHCSVDDLYDWYFKGKEGDENYEEFYDVFHKGYIKPKVSSFKRKLDEGASIHGLIKSNKNKITKKDVDIWIEHGLIDPKITIETKKDEEDEEDDDEKPKNSINKVDIGKIKKSSDNRSTLGRVNDTDYDVEELKKQILKK